MAKNKVEIDVKVDDKGTLGKVGLGAKKAGAGLDRAADASDNYHKKAKGAAGATSNSTKAFSKMATGSSGFVAAYATLAANIFAISAAFNFLKQAGNLKALQDAQEQYAFKTGTSMKLLTSRIQEASGSIISFEEAAQAAAIGRAAGLNSDQLEGLAKAAKNAGATLGRDIPDAFQRLTRGAIKAEPELLDELGIIIRLDTVMKDYKTALQITGRELTAFERTQAVVNAVLAQADEKFDDIGKNANGIAKLGKAFDDLIKNIQKEMIGPALFIADVFTKNIEALAAAFGLLGLSMARALTPAMPQMMNVAASAAGARARLSAAAGPGIVGQNIAGGTFGVRELNLAEASKSGSTVIDHSKITKAAILRDTAMIRADHARMVAENSTGFARYSRTAIANLRAMQAEHGRVMGTMKAGVAGFASFASKALNAIAILGVMTLAVSLAKELMNALKSDELKDFEDRNETILRRLQEQNKEVKNLADNLIKATSKMQKLQQASNLASNLSLSGFRGYQLPTGEVEKTKMRNNVKFVGDFREFKTRVAASIKSIKEFVASSELLIDAGNLAGLSTYDFSTRLSGLQKGIEALGDPTKLSAKEIKGFNKNVGELNPELSDLITLFYKLQTAVGAPAAALEAFAASTDKILKIGTDASKPTSSVRSLIEEYEILEKVLPTISNKQGKKPLKEILDERTLNSAKKLFGTGAGNRTADDLLQDNFNPNNRQTVSNRLLILREMETRELTGKAEAQKELNRGMQAYLPFLREEAQHKKTLADLDFQIDSLRDKELKAKLAGSGATDQERKRIDAQILALQEQKNLIEQNFTDIGKLGKAVGDSLEDNLSRAFESIITGTKSVKDAFLLMGQSILQMMAKILAEMAAEQVLRGIMTVFGASQSGTGIPKSGPGSFAADLANPNYYGAASHKRYGGVMSNGKKLAGYSQGGIASGRDAGYPAILHGTEAVVPLPNGRSIPVEMKGGGQSNVVVNVNMETGSTDIRSDDEGKQAQEFGKSIAVAVQNEIKNQKRAGGLLSPYGAA